MDRSDFDIIKKMDMIIEIINSNKLKTEYGYFSSKEDKAYKREIIDIMFCSLNPVNQKEAYKVIFELMIKQINFNNNEELILKN